MKKKLLIQALSKFFAGLVIVLLLLFVPAGTTQYWNAWLFACVLFIPVALMGVFLLRTSPELLARRLRADEKETEQKQVIQLSSIVFVVGFVTAGLDYRFQWSHLPPWLVFASAGIFLFGYVLFAAVMRQNAYLSRTVEVMEGQQIVDTGLYAMVRHPMYSATLLLFLSMPLVLGSLVSFVIFLSTPYLLIRRIIDEERVLMEAFPAYEQYMKKVKYRLIPHIW